MHPFIRFKKGAMVHAQPKPKRGPLPVSLPMPDRPFTLARPPTYLSILYSSEGHKEATVDDVVAVFQPYGEVAFVRLGRDKATKRITGTAFVEFANVEGLDK